MILLSNNITCISELKKNPSAIKDNLDTCVLSHNKPVYYTVNPSRYAELLKAEKENNDLDIRLYTAYDCAVSALQVCEDENIREYLMQIIKCNKVLK